MARVAIFGGGIAGLTAAFELEKQRQAGRPVEWYLFEASDRFGGTVSTTRLRAGDGEYVLEDGPDGWVTEKPWARELAEELGLGDEVIPCNEADKKTYIVLDGRLAAMPAGMRLMVPEDLRALQGSPLFSEGAKRAYAQELTRSEELRTKAPAGDEAIATFVRRHFGEEVLRNVAAPLLSGIFGGDVEQLSVRAIMAPFVRMEAEYGSLIAALQDRTRIRGSVPLQPTFTTLRRGMGSLAEALVKALPAERLQTRTAVATLARSNGGGWQVRFRGEGAHGCAMGMVPFDQVCLATPIDETRRLLRPLDPEAAALLPTEASSAVLATFCWPAERAAAMTVPQGFGFLVPARGGEEAGQASTEPQLLAATFADQKFAGRAPAGARVIRAFFGGGSAEALAGVSDEKTAKCALRALRAIMGPLPEPEQSLTTVRRWPRSLPQYHVGHLQRMEALETRVDALGGLFLLGNAYRGVGVPDLIRDAHGAARRLAGSLT